MIDKGYFISYAMLFTRYALIAGMAFLIFYVFFKERFKQIKIQNLFPARGDYLREVSFSLMGIAFIAFFAFSLRNLHIKPHTRLYFHISDYGWPYFVFSIFIAMLIHDTYFYWTHRLMHHRWLFKLFHLVHHRSTNPSPWAAYSFHPLEAVVEAAVLWVIVFSIPIHPMALRTFALIMISYNVYGHLGYEIYPKWLVNSRIGRWLNTSTNHNMHHKYFKDNYGLYFRFWDTLMGTTHPEYEERIGKLVK